MVLSMRDIFTQNVRQHFFPHNPHFTMVLQMNALCSTGSIYHINEQPTLYGTKHFSGLPSHVPIMTQYGNSWLTHHGKFSLYLPMIRGTINEMLYISSHVLDIPYTRILLCTPTQLLISQIIFISQHAIHDNDNDHKHVTGDNCGQDH